MTIIILISFKINFGLQLVRRELLTSGVLSNVIVRWHTVLFKLSTMSNLIVSSYSPPLYVRSEDEVKTTVTKRVYKWFLKAVGTCLTRQGHCQNIIPIMFCSIFKVNHLIAVLRTFLVTFLYTVSVIYFN